MDLSEDSIVGLFCIQIVKETPDGQKPEVIREVYVVATSPEDALGQLEAVKNDGVAFRCDEHKSRLVKFGATVDPKKSMIYH